MHSSYIIPFFYIVDTGSSGDNVPSGFGIFGPLTWDNVLDCAGTVPIGFTRDGGDMGTSGPVIPSGCHVPSRAIVSVGESATNADNGSSRSNGDADYYAKPLIRVRLGSSRLHSVTIALSARHIRGFLQSRM